MITLVWTIAFNDTNPQGDYVNGDVIDIYYDSDLDTSPGVNPKAGLSVKKNGVVITSGADISWTDQPYKTVNVRYSLICNNGFAVSFSPLSSFKPATVILKIFNP